MCATLAAHLHTGSTKNHRIMPNSWPGSDIDCDVPSSPNASPRDRRRSRRVKVNVELKLLAPDQHVMLLSHTLDLSREGAFVRSNKPLPIGSRVRLAFHRGTQREPLRVEAEVVRVGTFEQTTSPGIALKFRPLEESDERRLLSLIEQA